VHWFLHPGNKGLQTVEESAPERTIPALLAAKADLMVGFTAERDMGTEGAGSAVTVVGNAIGQGLAPGPRLRISANAVDMLGWCGAQEIPGRLPDRLYLDLMNSVLWR